MDIIKIDSENRLSEVAEAILERVGERRVVLFYGAMGAGKTTLIRELAEQLGVIDTVTSPTFSLVNQYLTSSGERVNHFDFYRIERLEEVYDIGYEEYFYGGDLCLVEWPEKVDELLPEDVMVVRIELDPKHDNGRIFTII